MLFISGGAANETLAATPTKPEEFVFTSFATGMHTITGFNTTQDVIGLSIAEFGNFAAVQIATTAVTGGAIISLGNSTSLMLPGVDRTTLHAGNFAFG
jgi:hypothetical protein